VLTSRPNVTPVEAESGVIFGGGPPAGSTDEANLDVEMVYAMAPKATISVFQGTTGITDRMDAILHHMATFTPPSSPWRAAVSTSGKATTRSRR
jgi:subtilase family serine protease